MSREKMHDSQHLIQEPIIEKCEGCAYIKDGHCVPYIFPAAKWRSGSCPLATHLEKSKVTEAQKKRVGQQKAVKQHKLSKKQEKSYSRLGMGGK